MSTQEFSQWVVDGNMERSNVHNTLTYMPNQSGYIGFEDIELSISQHGTQIDITPHVETRSVQFPENKRFIEPETPVPGFKNVIRDGSSGGIELQTPMLPEATFGNPFGEDHDADSGVMALSQIFKATQAPSSPGLPRQLPSSQRPSPVLLRRGPPNAGSDTAVQQLSEPEDLLQMIVDGVSSSPHCPTAGSQLVNQRKRARTEDDSSSLFDGLNPLEAAWVGASVAKPKRRRISETRADQQPDKPESINSKTPEKVSWKTARQTTSPQPDSKAITIEDEANTTEDETEREDVRDSDHIEDQESDDDSNKENKTFKQNAVLASGSNIRRAPQRLQNQTIPLSSSPAIIDPAFLQLPSEKHTSLPHSPSARKSTVLAVESSTNRYITIADSQSSPVQPRAEQVLSRSQHGSSSDSRQIVPQSQAAKPASSLRITSTIVKAVSQQTASPPDSTTNEEVERAPRKTPEPDQDEVTIAQTRPVSPNSSPSPNRHNSARETVEGLKRSLPQLNAHVVQDVIPTPDQQAGLSRQSQNQAATRVVRSSSAIPETAYVSRRGNAYSASFPVPHGDPFAAAENIEFGFKGHSQLDELESTEQRPLAASFKSQRARGGLRSPIRQSPRRPRTFSAIAGDMSTQEQDSLELDAVFTAEDQEIRDMLARMPASGSSPLDPVRKRRQRKAPVLLHHSSDTVEPSSQEAVPDQEKGLLLDAVTEASQLQLMDKDSTAAQTISEPNQEDAPPPKEPTASLENSMPKQQYGRKAKRWELSQAKSTSTKSQPKLASPILISKDSDKPPVDTHSRRKSKTKAAAKTATVAHQSASTEIVKPSKRPNKAKPVAIQAAHITIPGNSTSSLETLFHHRVFAEFRGSPPGYFAATCTSCWKGEAELKYSIRFDDGSIDQLGQALIKSLELRVGDEVKVYRRQYQSSTFTVTGFGDVLAPDQLEQQAFPMTDVYGHTAVRVKLKSNGKKTSKDADEMEIPITEVFFTRGMRSAFRDRDYSHPMVDAKQLMTPTHSGPSSNIVSPHSRTRSTNKLNLPASTLSDGISKKLGSDQPITRTDGFFKDVVFIFTNSPKIKEQSSNAIEHEGGTILKGQKDLEDLFETPIPLNIDQMEDDEGSRTIAAPADGRRHGISIKAEFKGTGLTVLVADRVCKTTKYYQALALGIPCVSSRWVTDCLQSRKLKSWRPYLLAAGESEMLDTTVSQQLNLSRDEIDSCHVSLSTLTSRRARWLQDTTILLVGNGGDDCEKRLGAYTFFAWILGAANVAVASDSKTAEQYLAQDEQHFDWICIDNEKEKSSSKGDRKSKRLSDVNLHGYAKTGDRSTRLIDTQHITESLILGSLVDAKDL